MKKSKYLFLTAVATTLLLAACGDENEKEIEKEVIEKEVDEKEVEKLKVEEKVEKEEKIQIDEKIKLVENEKYKVIAAITKVEEAGETDLAVTNVVIKNETEKDMVITKIKVKALNEDGSVNYEKETTSLKGYYIEPKKEGYETFVYELEKGVKKEEYEKLKFEVEVVVEEYQGPKFLGELDAEGIKYELVNGFLFIEGKVINKVDETYKNIYTNYVIYNNKDEIIKINEYSAVRDLKKGNQFNMEYAIKYDGKVEDIKKIEMKVYGIKEN